jgi:anion transporter
MAFILTITIFVLTYIIIISEKIHRTKIALLGAFLLIIVRVLDFEKALRFIDFNTIFLLIGMMIFVSIFKDTGIFEFIAIKLVKLVRGKSFLIMIVLSVFTAAASALLDNVTTVLLLAPITILITQTLNKNPAPFLMAQIFAANIGGTATLIGDPPNILIGSAAGLTFVDFLVHLGPVVLICMAVILFLLYFIYRGEWKDRNGYGAVLSEIDENEALKDKKLLLKSLFVLALVLICFFIHGLIHVEAGIIAFTGAILAMIISNSDVEQNFKHVEWPVLFFFIGLFILVGGLEEIGVLNFLAKMTLSLTGNFLILVILIVVVSAVFSSFIDNIPFVVAMIPLVREISRSIFLNAGGHQLLLLSMPLWWALSLGACFGGNGTLIGASANLVVAGFSEKTSHPITFKNYIKVGFPLMIVTIGISILYLYLRYFMK